MTPAARAASRDRMAAACRRLALSPQVVTACETTAPPTQEALLLQVLAAEVAHRDTRRRTRLARRAGFPVPKSLTDYDRQRVTLPSTLTWDDQLAAAMIDRLTLHGYLLLFQGESYRMAHALMKER